MVFENHSTLTSIALRNSQLSHRGSIRQHTCALGWVGMIYKLVDCGALRSTDDGSALLKQYNAMASTSGIIQGNQRSSILNLLSAPRDAVSVMLDALSRLSAKGIPWHDDAFSKKTSCPVTSSVIQTLFGANGTPLHQRVSVSWSAFKSMSSSRNCQATVGN